MNANFDKDDFEALLNKGELWSTYKTTAQLPSISLFAHNDPFLRVVGYDDVIKRLKDLVHRYVLSEKKLQQRRYELKKQGVSERAMCDTLQKEAGHSLVHLLSGDYGSGKSLLHACTEDYFYLVAKKEGLRFYDGVMVHDKKQALECDFTLVGGGEGMSYVKRYNRKAKIKRALKVGGAAAGLLGLFSVPLLAVNNLISEAVVRYNSEDAGVVSSMLIKDLWRDFGFLVNWTFYGLAVSLGYKYVNKNEKKNPVELFRHSNRVPTIKGREDKKVLQGYYDESASDLAPQFRAKNSLLLSGNGKPITIENPDGFSKDEALLLEHVIEENKVVFCDKDDWSRFHSALYLINMNEEKSSASLPRS
ncbi:hypothetical protein COT72_04835 [archaeon CG10_big_fil_rev_8_21_14_0_10_43_11]|nr:MAG: hypothetical protein COT72_04835 [archaeon CG10_big_fil_rev_8_21_14_0_10_43_11]